MGIEKTLNSDFEIPVGYWRIRNGSSDYDKKITFFTLEGYPDKATRGLDPKPSPVQTVFFTIPGHDRSRAEAYAYLKENKVLHMGNEIDLTGAQDA